MNEGWATAELLLGYREVKQIELHNNETSSIYICLYCICTYNAHKIGFEVTLHVTN